MKASTATAAEFECSSFTLMVYVLFVLVACLSSRLAVAAIDVTARRDGDAIVVDANAYVPVKLSAAWAVLNDFDHHAQFIPDLKSSHVISRPGETLRVEQTKISRFGLLRFSVESTWEIETIPCESVTARSVGGNIGKVEVVARVHAMGDGIQVNYHASTIPDTSIPNRFLVGMVKTDIEQRLQGLSDEMLRRKASHSASSLPDASCDNKQP